MTVAAVTDRKVLVLMADHDGTMLAISRCAFAMRTATGMTVTTTVTASTKKIATAFRRGLSDQTAGRQVLPGASRRSPTIHLAMTPAINVTASRGTAKAVARPKSYRAANAVNTSVVKTRTRSKPGTPNSATESANTTSPAAATSGATSGSVMRRNTRPRLALTSPASSSDASTRLKPASDASIDTGKKAVPSTSAAPLSE